MHFRSAHFEDVRMHGPSQAVCDCIIVGHRAITLPDALNARACNCISLHSNVGVCAI
jgi:hypothetical protein